MHKSASGVLDRLEAGEQAAAKWRRDARYTPEAKAVAMLAARKAAREEAVTYARSELRRARSRKQAAVEAHAAARRAVLAGLDVQRQLYMSERAKAAASDAAALLALAGEALETLDYGSLLAVQSFVLPELRQLIGRQYGDGFVRPTLEPSDFQAVKQRVKVALVDAQPPELAAAALELEAAEADLSELRSDLERVNDRAAAAGGPGPLADVLAGPVGVTSGSVESGRVSYGRLPVED